MNTWVKSVVIKYRVHDVYVGKKFNVSFKWGWTKSHFDINSVVFHFDDFNYGRRLQPSILSDCNFNSSAGEVSDTQGLWEGVGPVHRYRTRRAKKGHRNLWRDPLIFDFDFFIIIFCIFNFNPQFWEKFQYVLGPQSSIVPLCKISLGGPGTKCWQIITFCNGPAGSPSGNFSPGIL